MNTPHVLTAGAGTGHRMLIKSLKSLPVRITAILNVTDNGGHTGSLRREYNIPAIGDLRQCLTALLPDSHPMKPFLEHRFSEGSLNGQQLGNLMITAMLQQGNPLSTFSKSFSERFLESNHSILPASNESGDIGCVLADGERIVGEWDIIERNNTAHIQSLFHEPELPLLPDVKRKVQQADHLVIPPGNLHTGVLSCLLTGSFPDLLRKENLTITYVCNLLTFPPLTPDYSAADHIRWIEKTVNDQIDHVIYSSSTLPDESLQVYRDQYPKTKPVDRGSIPDRINVVQGDLATTTRALQHEEGIRAGSDKFKSAPHLIRHHPGRLATKLQNVLSI